MMKRQYTEQEINLFFTRFKQLPEYFEIEKVHQLINNPDAKATHRVNFKYKPFKFIMMTSLFIVGISSFLLWLNPNFENGKKKDKVLQTIPFSAKTNQIDNTGKETKTVEIQSKQSIQSNNQTVYKTEEPNKNIVVENDTTSVLPANYDLISSNKSIETFWPEDTVIDGGKFIITLTDKELENIGFMIDRTGLYYFNQYNDLISSFFCHKDSNFWSIYNAPSTLKYNKKVNNSNFDFYPVTYTNTFNSTSEFSKDIFEMMNDTLMPLLVKPNQSKNNEGIILWFKITDNLFNYLPNRYHHLKIDYQKIIECKRKFIKADVVGYEAKKITETMKFIELNINQYTKLGFDIKSDKIQIRTKGWNVFLSKKSTGVRTIKSEEQEIKLIFLANKSGHQMIKWAISGDDEEKFDNEYFKSKIQNLVPILMKKSAFPDILNEDQVFWFEPSDALFSALPEHIGKQLRMEYNYISAETDDQRIELTTNCTYFEACKSTLKAENCKLYPNPASTSATLEFSMPETAIGNISLANISGSQLKILVPTTSFPNGNNSFKFDVAGISPGIYLVLIKTDKGFKTQRLIISK